MGVPNSWMVDFRKSQSKLDDLGVLACFLLLRKEEVLILACLSCMFFVWESSLRPQKDQMYR